MRPADTDPKTWEMWIGLFRRMPLGEKLQRTLEATDMMFAMQEAGIRLRHPHASPREVTIRAVAARYGNDLARRAYGWAPDSDEPCR